MSFIARRISIAWFLVLSLFLSYEIYYFTFVPNPLNIKMYLKLLTLFLCLLFSILKLLGLRRYRFIKGYVLIIFLVLSIVASIIPSPIPIYSAIQCLLFASLLIVTTYTAEYIVEIKDFLIISSVAQVTAVIVIVSLVVYLIFPSAASGYESGHIRVSGIFGEPSHMAIMCGLAVGLAFTSINNKIMKYTIVVFSMILLYLTGSRGPVVALVVVSVIYLLLFYKGNTGFKVVMISLLACSVAFIVVYKRNAVIDTSYMRGNTLSTMSGRTLIWEYAIQKSILKPFGSGYGLGGSILQGSQFMPSLYGANDSPNTDVFSYSSNRSYKASLHSGYVQALADLGIFGFLLYCLVILKGWVRSIALRKERFVLPFVFICLYLSLCNLTEAVIMSPTSSLSLLYYLSWFVLAFHGPEIEQVRALAQNNLIEQSK